MSPPSPAPWRTSSPRKTAPSPPLSMAKAPPKPFTAAPGYSSPNGTPMSGPPSPPPPSPSAPTPATPSMPPASSGKKTTAIRKRPPQNRRLRSQRFLNDRPRSIGSREFTGQESFATYCAFFLLLSTSYRLHISVSINPHADIGKFAKTPVEGRDGNILTRGRRRENTIDKMQIRDAISFQRVQIPPSICYFYSG